MRQLLKIAKHSVPKKQWKKTPVVLKATAGLRLLPNEKAQALLEEVLYSMVIFIGNRKIGSRCQKQASVSF